MPTHSTYVITDSSFPDPPLKHATRLHGPSATVRVAAARLRGGMPDRGLAVGADPAASPRNAARTAQLGSASIRALIADGLERVVLSVDNPHSRLRIWPSRAAMLADRSDLLALPGMLRCDRPLYARGVAMLKMILADGTGPASADQRDDALARQLQVARSSLSR